MGSKIHQGPFNCHAAALPDEEIFTVLARDPAMPETLRFWCAERIRLGKNDTNEDRERVDEAYAIADRAEMWRGANINATGDGVPSWKLPRPSDEDNRVVGDNPAEIAAKEDMGSHYTAWRTALWDKACCANDESTFDYYVHEIQKMDHCFVTLGFAVPKNRHIPIWESLQDRNTEATLQDRLAPIADAISAPLETLVREREKVAYGENDSLTVPDEVPAHRFAHFHKSGRYAYAKGLEVAPVHLAAALDAMDQSGWELLAIFGETDSKNVGFIFRRGPPTLHDIKYRMDVTWPPSYTPQSDQMDAYESGRPLGEIDEMKERDVRLGDRDAGRIAPDLGRGQEP